MRIAFDVDDTLIVPSVVTGFDRDTPNYENIALYRWFQAQGCEMIIWSGGGQDYARMWGEKLGLQPFKSIKKVKHYSDPLLGIPYVDIAFDDCDVDLASVNVKVKRLKNGISRAEWNDHRKFNQSKEA